MSQEKWIWMSHAAHFCDNDAASAREGHMLSCYKSEREEFDDAEES